MAFDLKKLVQERAGENYALHDTHLNSQFVKVLKTIGFNKIYTKARGQYLWDEQDQRYLDLLSGFGVFGIGRNHPTVTQALKDVLDADLPNLVQMDCSLLAGLLAEKLKTFLPQGLERMFFCSSGTEAVEAAIKFSRSATKRSKIIFCDHAFHGLSCGALSLNGDMIFKEGFGPLLGDVEQVPFNDLEALEAKLISEDVAAFFVEPIQGKGINLPSDSYLSEVARLCRQYGTLLVMDEVQTGMGRTGKFLASEHWGIEPDMVMLAKSLSGGQVPIGAVICKKWIFEKVFHRMDKAVVHGSTFSKNNCAMAAGLATLAVMEDEKLIEKADQQGRKLKENLAALIPQYEFLKEVRGMGMMIGVEFGAPKSFSLKTAWTLLEKANKGLFCQMITIPLFKKHRIISQVAGHGSYVVKLIPPLGLVDEDLQWITQSFDEVIADAHRFPGAVWELATSLAGHALTNKSAATANKGAQL